MKTRTAPRARPADRGKRREENAARDETINTSEPATELPANTSDSASMLNQYKRQQESDVALLTLDTIARGSLSMHSFERYRAYKRALLLSDQDLQSVSLTLILFIQGLYLEREDTTLH